MKYTTEKIGKRIKELRQSANLTQSALGDRLGISGKQISNYESGQLVPPMDMLFSICELFDCELGFLLCEPEYENKTQLLTLISKSTGLDLESIKSIQQITGNSRSCIHWGLYSDHFKHVINKLLTSPAFVSFIEQLAELDDYITKWNTVFDEIKTNYPHDTVKQAFYYYEGPVDYMNDESIILDHEIIKIIKMIDSAIDNQRDIGFDVKLAKLEGYQAAHNILNEMYQDEPAFDI